MYSSINHLPLLAMKEKCNHHRHHHHHHRHHHCHNHHGHHLSANYQYLHVERLMKILTPTHTIALHPLIVVISY